MRSRIADQGPSQHRPPNLTQHQVASKQWYVTIFIVPVSGSNSLPSVSSIKPVICRSSDDKGSPEYGGQTMDIHSGHLALTYMEQYHKNQDKIGAEWEVGNIVVNIVVDIVVNIVYLLQPPN